MTASNGLNCTDFAPNAIAVTRLIRKRKRAREGEMRGFPTFLNGMSGYLVFFL